MSGNWFGKAPEPMRLVPLAEAKATFFMDVLCDGWAAYDVRSFAALVEELRARQMAHPRHRILTSLDDLGQASYTCGHTVATNQLDWITRADLTEPHPEWFEDGEEQGALSGPAGLPYMLDNLLALARDVALDELHEFLPWDEPDRPGRDPASLNTDPDQFLMLAYEREVLIQLVPVQRAADALAALPNGYFQPDLSPMQNHVLACELEERHGLALFGIGASTLAFWRDTVLGDVEAAEVAALITALYYDRPGDAADRLAAAITGKSVVLLRYTES